MSVYLPSLDEHLERGDVLGREVRAARPRTWTRPASGPAKRGRSDGACRNANRGGSARARRSRGTRAFTLVEMLVATVLASVLIGGVLTATAALSRDRRRMEAAEAGEQSTAPADLVRHDLANATALVGSPSATGFTLVGHGGIDAKSFAPDGRLCRVDYRVRAGVLSRHQSYLDDPIRPDPWAEVVAVGVRQIALTPVSADGERVRLSEDLEGRLTSRTTGQPLAATRVPSRLRLRIETGTGVTDKELVLR